MKFMFILHQVYVIDVLNFSFTNKLSIHFDNNQLIFEIVEHGKKFLSIPFVVIELGCLITNSTLR